MPDMFEKKTPEHLEFINDIDVEELASETPNFSWDRPFSTSS